MVWVKSERVRAKQLQRPLGTLAVEEPSGEFVELSGVMRPDVAGGLGGRS